MVASLKILIAKFSLHSQLRSYVCSKMHKLISFPPFRVDACESKTEIMTPYWALNSARKLRAIVNTMHFEQAIHQEECRYVCELFLH